jgi:hypothetical protein
MSDELDIPHPTYRVQRTRRGMDPATKRLAIIAGGLGGALVLLVGGWSLVGHRSTGVPVIKADSSPMRVKPVNPGGMQVAGTRDEILADGADASVDKLAPGSEAPAPQDLKAATAGTTASAIAGSAPTPVAPTQTVPAQAVAAAPPVKPAAPTRAVSVASDHPALPHPMVGGRSTLVQLAALGSEDAAKIEWHRLEKRMPDLLASRQPALSRIDHDGKTFWRLRTGGFADIAQATAFCEQVRAKGNGCSIAAF